MINKKVLHVVNISFVLPYYIGDQFDFFMEKGVKFYVACQASKHLSEYSAEKDFIPKEVNILRKISPYEDFKAVYKLWKIIKAEKIDLVIGHTPKGGLIGLLAAYLAGVEQRIYFRHGLMYETSNGVKRFFLRGIEIFTGYLATKVVCVSPSVISLSNTERLSAASKNIILNKGTCNGIDALYKFNNVNIDIEHVFNLREMHGLSSEDRIIGYVGRLVNDKGINELLLAWKELLKVHSDIKLLLVGPLEERDSLSEEATSYIKNTPSIIYTGLIKDVEFYYCLMNIFILPSYREGFPTVVLEASAMELPVITTRVTGCKDSIIENHTGVFVDLNPDDIKIKIDQYLNNPQLAKKHGIMGRSFVLNNFDQLKIWSEIENKVFECNS